MLTAHQLSKTFDLDPLFENVTFSVNRGERVGLIGPNGSGKTTLFRILTGELSATSGHVAHSADLRIGYLPQGFELDPDKTLGETLDLAVGNIDALETELGDIAMAMAESPNDAALQERYDVVLERIISAETGTAATITTALGLDKIDPTLPNHVLSGGQKTRLALALILLRQPDLLLLDEPTNHLDIEMLEWLENWLAGFQGGVLLISHDRTF
ncbi:MAG: ATP-binding cassette domain-containing protein, partial [Candidatus Promineifilaceae bacterium]